jgi:hypothetical protein
MINPEDILVLCDGESDAELFKQIRVCHPKLTEIPVAKINTYDQARFNGTDTPLTRAVLPLHIDDRPDFIFCYQDKPILIVEMTEHAYTGDNGLQRFARCAVAAENRLPFIYFGPLRRTRDDELDTMEEGTASARSLTSDMFEGMKRLNDIYKSPQLYVEWHTSENGMPIKLGSRATAPEITKHYGELLALIAAVLLGDGSAAAAELIAEKQAQTTTLAGIKNTRESDVRFFSAASQTSKLVQNAAELCGLLDGGEYFDKGKPDKLLAKFSLTRSSITVIQLPNGRVISKSDASFSDTLAKVLNHPKFRNQAMLYYTGYKWRSDPHCGALVNVDYRLCRSKGEKTPKERTTPLIVFYPRISGNKESGLWKVLQKAGPQTTELKELFVARYGSATGLTKLEKCTNSKNLFSLWGNSTKQARLFRRYADIVVLNDGLILGNALGDLFT